MLTDKEGIRHYIEAVGADLNPTDRAAIARIVNRLTDTEAGAFMELFQKIEDIVAAEVRDDSPIRPDSVQQTARMVQLVSS